MSTDSGGDGLREHFLFRSGEPDTNRRGIWWLGERADCATGGCGFLRVAAGGTRDELSDGGGVYSGRRTA